MKHPPRLSIITPSFNQASFLTENLHSVHSQGVSYEHIIMDGGSTDESLQVLKSFAGPLRIESKKDRGQSHAINKGLGLAHGEIIAFLNSDDYYLPGTFKTVSDHLKANPQCMWVVGDAVIVDANGQEIQPYVRLYKRLLRAVYSSSLLAILNPLPQPAIFWRREVSEAIGTFDESLSYTMDYDYWWRIQERFGNPTIIATPLAAFRIHSASKGGSRFRQQFAEELTVARKYCSSTLLLALHAFHNRCILLAYQLLK